MVPAHQQGCISLLCSAAAGLLTSTASVLECKQLSSSPTAGAGSQLGCKLWSRRDIAIAVMQPMPMIDSLQRLFAVGSLDLPQISIRLKVQQLVGIGEAASAHLQAGCLC